MAELTAELVKQEIIEDSFQVCREDFRPFFSEVFQDREFLLDFISKPFGGSVLSFLPEYYDDREVVLKAVENWHTVFEKVSEWYGDDEEIVLTGISNVPMAYVYAKGKLVNNRDFALKAVKAHHLAFAFMENFHDDREIAKIAISNNPRTYKYASNRLHDDDELFLMAAKQVPSMAEYASERLVKKYMKPKKS